MRPLTLGLLGFSLASLTFGAEAPASPWRIAGGFSTDWDHLVIESRLLAPQVYYLHGSGANTVALVGPEGTLVVDTEFAQVAPKLDAALAKLGPGPVRYIISSHYHPDHTGGNPYFHNKGALVIAQTQARARLLQSQFSPFWNQRSAAIPDGDAPGLTYETALTLHLNGEEVTASHVATAHTDGDTVVYFKPANVVAMGDIFVNNLYPYIDVGAKGNIDGYFPVIDDVLSRIDASTIVVPGHGDVTDKERLQAYRDILWTIRSRIAVLVAQGKSLEDIIAANPSREFDREWASNRVGPDGIAAMVYQSLTGRRLDWHPPR